MVFFYLVINLFRDGIMLKNSVEKCSQLLSNLNYSTFILQLCASKSKNSSVNNLRVISSAQNKLFRERLFEIQFVQFDFYLHGT